MLRTAIQSVGQLVLPEGFSFTLLVIDNYPSEDVRRVIQEETQTLNFPVEYVPEETRGLVYARNRVLIEAERLNIDYLAMFDDDDYLDSQWLVTMVDCMYKYDATVVFGRMEFKWPKSMTLEDEIRFVYDNPFGNIKTGDLRARCGTGNTLFDFSFIQKHQLRFHPMFNLTGGEDSHFTESMTLLGARIIRCNEAIIYSDVVQERATEEFIWSRRYNVGYVTFIKDKLLFGKARTVRKALWLIIKDSYKILISSFSKSRKVQVKRKRKRIELKGLIDAMTGVKYESYAKTDGH